MNAYRQMKMRHQAEVNNFPMAFAFINETQLEKGMKKLGLEPTDKDKILMLGGSGCFIRKDDKPRFDEMMKRQRRERDDAIAGDETGEGFILDMWLYELGNHDYAVTGDIVDAMKALGLTFEDITKDRRMIHALELACERLQGFSW